MRRLLFLAVSVACLSAPASAQQATRLPDPAAVPREVKKSDQAVEAQRVLNDYGACVVKTARRRAEAALQEYPDSDEAGKAMLKLATSDCLMTGELRFKSTLLRGSLFEALYDTDFKSRAADISVVAPLDYFAGAKDPSSDDVRNQVALRQFADCVVRTNSGGARALILSKVGDEAERAAFDSLMPALSECLTQGVELKFSRPMLRGLVAETLYRLSRAAMASATASSR